MSIYNNWFMWTQLINICLWQSFAIVSIIFRHIWEDKAAEMLRVIQVRDYYTFKSYQI